MSRRSPARPWLNRQQQQTPPALPARNNSTALTTTNQRSVNLVDEMFGTGGSSYTNNYGSNYGSNYGGYGTGMYGSYGNRYGGYNSYGSGYGSGYGGYGGGYNSYGSGYGGYGGYNNYNTLGGGYGMNDPRMGPARGPGQVVHGAVDSMHRTAHVFGTFAELLHTTSGAIFSSFRALIGVSQHFTQLLSFLGLTGYFSLIRKFLRARRGLPVDTPRSADEPNNMLLEFYNQHTGGGQADGRAGAIANQSLTIRGLIALVVLGAGAIMVLKKFFVWLMHVIDPIDPQQLPHDGQFAPSAQIEVLDEHGNPVDNTQQLQQQPSLIEFRALYDFQGDAANRELSFHKNDLLVVLDKDGSIVSRFTESANDDSEGGEWWIARHVNDRAARALGCVGDNAIGFIPSNYVKFVRIKNVNTTDADNNKASSSSSSNKRSLKGKEKLYSKHSQKRAVNDADEVTVEDVDEAEERRIDDGFSSTGDVSDQSYDYDTN